METASHWWHNLQMIWLLHRRTWNPHIAQVLLSVSASLTLLVAAAAAAPPKETTLKSCSFQKVNTQSCFVIYDREAQIVPPNIQIEHGLAVEIRVKNTRPVEVISIEAQPVTLLAAPEPFQSAFQAFLPSLKSVVAVQTTDFDRAECDAFLSVSPYKELAVLLKAQEQADIDAQNFSGELKKLNAELLEPQAAPLETRVGLRTPDPRTTGKFREWKEKMSAELQPASKNPNPRLVTGDAGNSIHSKLVEASKATVPPDQKTCYAKALQRANESDEILTVKYKFIADTQSTLAQTAQLVDQLPNDPPVDATKQAKDPDSKSLMYRKAPFAIVSTNQLGKTPTPKTLATVTIVFGSSRIEAFSGAVFSTLAGRSFQTSPVFVNGNKTNTSIIQTITRPTIIPFASVNYRLIESDKRFALFATGGIGVNPYSTSADFFGGISVSYRSFVLSSLLDYGRDLKLTQGLYVNELLGASGPSPTTQRFWRPAFGIGLSVRLSNLIGGNSAAGGN